MTRFFNYGVFTLDGADLEVGLERTHFRESRLDSNVEEKLYSNLDLRFEILAKNKGAQEGWATLSLRSFELREVSEESAAARAKRIADVVVRVLQQFGVKKIQQSYLGAGLVRNLSSLRSVEFEIKYENTYAFADSKSAAIFMGGVLNEINSHPEIQTKSKLNSKSGGSKLSDRTVECFRLIK